MPPAWTEEQQTIIHRHMGGDSTLPIYCRCTNCLVFIRMGNLDADGACPICHEPGSLIECCPLDSCHCSHPVSEGVEYCPICEAPLCPICGSHDVAQVSRITGYLGDVKGWNAAKQQELKDRVHYAVNGGLV